MRGIPPLALLAMIGCASENGLNTTIDPGVAPNPADAPAIHKVDRLVQVQVPEVDVLFVVDNSGSMGSFQAELAENFPVFMDFFLGSGLDYHIGVTTTDMNSASDQGKLRSAAGAKWIDVDTENPDAVFSSLALVGDNGASAERGRDGAYAALELESGPGGANEGFLREDAALHITIISDEEDDSTLISRPEFSNYLNTLKAKDDMVTFSSIVSPSPTCAGAVEPGDEYIAVTNAVGGIFWSICAEDWAQMLENLGIQATGLKREYFLSQLPIETSIEVRVETEGVTYVFERDVEWEYNRTRNSISFFEYVPDALSQVVIDYDLLSATEAVVD